MSYIVNNLIKGVFIREAKTRFLCEVKVDGKIVLCYVPISCKLSNLIEIKESDVLLSLNNKGAKTQYTLFAIKYNERYVIVNAGLANKLINKYYCENKPKINLKAEVFIENYKCDFYNETHNLIIEVKSLISLNAKIILPNMVTKRAIEQLKKINQLIKKGYKIKYYFLVLSGKSVEILIERKSVYGKLLYQCVKDGMEINCFDVSIVGNEIHLSKEENINFI